jgi:hypothetical protein
MAEALEGLEARWRDMDAPVLARLRRGLSEAEMDALAAEYGHELGEQQRAWWAWHDGVEGFDGPLDDPNLWVKPHTVPCSLKEALDFAAEATTWNPPPEEIAAGIEPLLWDPDWLPFLEFNGWWVSRNERPEGPSAVTYSKNFPVGQNYTTESLEHFVDVWCWGIDHGVLVLDAGVWENRAGLTPVPYDLECLDIL